MAKLRKVRISQFLKERTGRYHPDDESVRSLKRLDKIDFSGNVYLTDKDSKTDMIIIEPGDLVISGINVSKGAIAIYYGEEPITATIHYSSYTFDESVIDIHYFKRFIRSQYFIQALKDQVKGGIKTEIKPKHLLPLEIYLPDTTQQKEIVSFFDNVESEIASTINLNNQQKCLINNLRQQILQEAIEGKLTAKWREQHPDLISGANHAAKLLENIQAEKERLIKEGVIKKDKSIPPVGDEEKPFELPDGWVWCRLISVSKKITDGTHHSPTNLMTGDFKYITAKNIKDTGVDLKEVSFVSSDVHKEIYSRCNPEKGDILYIKDGATTGIVTINNLEEEFSMLSSVALVKPLINSRYLMYAMKSPLFYQNMRKDMFGVAITRVTIEKITKSINPLPPIFEQSVIVERVENVLVMIDELEKQVSGRKEQSEKLTQSILREAFATS